MSPRTNLYRHRKNSFAATFVLLAAFSILSPQPVHASDDIYLRKFLACGNFSDPANRAACFEAALREYNTDHPGAHEQSAKTADPTAPQWTTLPPATQTEPASPPAKAQTFSTQPQGSSAPSNTTKQAPENIIARVDKFSRNPLGRIIIELDNGQTWIQTDNQHVRLSANDEIKITKNFIGGYKLAIPDRGTFVRVKRIK